MMLSSVSSPPFGALNSAASAVAACEYTMLIYEYIMLIYEYIMLIYAQYMLVCKKEIYLYFQ